MFVQNTIFRTLSLNCGYIVPFKHPRDTRQINFIAQRSYAKNPKLVIEAYNDATRFPYTYLLMDFTQKTPDFLRLRSNTFPHDIDNSLSTVYLPNE